MSRAKYHPALRTTARVLVSGVFTTLLALTAACSDFGTDSVREKNTATVRSFLSLLEQERIEDYLALYAEDGVQLNPYASGLFPAEVRGKAALREFWEPVPARVDGMRFPITEIVPMQDPNRLLVRFKGQIKLKGGAGEYNNDYYGLFRFDANGKVVEYVEIFNPLTIVRCFGLQDQI